MNKDMILGRLSPYGKKRILIKTDQGVPDIISAMLSAHKIYASEYDKISQDFYAGDGIQTAKNVFNFLKKNVKYKIESENNQRIMSPSAIISLGRNDCKNYALFIMGVLDSLKRKKLINNDIYFRFASYKLLDEIPHHVFVVIKDKDGTEYFVDPVLSSFNERKVYYHKIDKRPNNMPLYSISGLGETSDKAKRYQRKRMNPVGATETASQEPPKKKIVLKIALAPARGAFLLLVGLNFVGLATKLKKSFDEQANATQYWWANLGGNPNELLRKVNQGAVKRRLLGDEIEFASEGQIGIVEPVTATAATATVVAAPILVKVAEFLAKIGIDTKEIAEIGKRVLAKQVKNVLEKTIEDKSRIDQETEDEVNRIVNETDQYEADGTKKSMNYIPFIVGGALVVFLLTKKK